MKRIVLIIFSLSFLAFLSGCNENNVDNGLHGKLTVKITDDPFAIDFVESATVTITKVEIRKAGAESDSANPFSVIMEDTVTFNLIDLQNGKVDELLSAELPNGEYDLIRIYVDETGLKVKDNPDTFKVKVPSGKQTGIKVFIDPAININGGLTSELLLDFDLSRSFVMRGNLSHALGINGFIFKPVVRAVNTSSTGRLEGVVTDTATVSITSASVWVEQDTMIATTFSDTLGRYAFVGLPAGYYSVSATRENYDTVSFSGVEIVEGNKTVQDFSLTPQ